MIKSWSIMAVIFLLMTLISFNLKLSGDNVAYPDGYRSWTHVKSGILGPEHPNVHYRGFNHVYANDLAKAGYRTGKFPEGAEIIVDVIEAVTAENYISEGQRRHMDVMLKDSVRFAETGGWGYAQFERDNSPRMLTLEQKKACFNCHAKQKDHVFSEFRN
jgi:hypothetical protein